MRLGGRAIDWAFDTDGIWKAYRRGERVYSEHLTIGPNSVDVTLGPILLVPERSDVPLDPERDEQVPYTTESADPQFVLPVGGFALGCTQERFDCSEPLPLWHGPRLSGRTFVSHVDGRSTVGRLGLLVHVTAGYGDYGFEGAYTLELSNVGFRPLVLRAGMRIAQVSFTQVLLPRRYSGAYANTDHYDAPVPPRTGPTRFR